MQQRFEHKIVWDLSRIYVENEIDTRAKQGWELVSAAPLGDRNNYFDLFFKRPVQVSQPNAAEKPKRSSGWGS
ncbi:MAG: hypothetical protein A2806_03765 [Candidatus Terrybacteria bacterium RIFCSPHIGHO2_01_FULL_48_17]|uniref:DUF4177 domain-containing protein n=1 Tax=Candidatus Terrybacteria bacterium RIFCSPHIGHO2_01_FULL_48_17 TaxID=1802362 RepID=A0A1G2PI93_9BACT|nr:MAG: hypothetical protein A2806_03765 [Candidatus Terrybacteria bacterium RIFCSPHIGHO2_01_FULL_48_17]OHA53918.1 MAG: hypothetical protein A3A30_03825 [Candidatus Terrybacteria bacterium RIFCSPLOWO2_01_FULL_48_14]